MENKIEMKEEKIAFEMPQIIDITMPEAIGQDGGTNAGEPEQEEP